MSSRWRRPGGDAGQLTLLIIGLVLILVVLVLVVISASRVFLAQRALSAAADGAAIFAVNQVDETVVYIGGAGEQLPISATAARQAVAEYAARAGLAGRYDQFAFEVSTDGRTVRVTFTGRVRIPLDGVVTDRYEDGITITMTALAVAPTRS